LAREGRVEAVRVNGPTVEYDTASCIKSGAELKCTAIKGQRARCRAQIVVGGHLQDASGQESATCISILPDSWSVPAPAFAIPPVPERTPLNVAPKPLVSIVETPLKLAFTLVTSAVSITLIVPPPRLNW